MKILLDTHILTWFHTNDIRLSKEACELVSSQDNNIYYSPVSIWESEIKNIVRPNDFPFTSKRLDELCRESGMLFLPLRSEQIFLLHTLHYSEKAKKPHKDPFDRMLICQAKAENMKFITHDSLIPFYEEDCIVHV